MTATIIRFPDEPPGRGKYVDAHTEPATIIILPVIRIERAPALWPKGNRGTCIDCLGTGRGSATDPELKCETCGGRGKMRKPRRMSMAEVRASVLKRLREERTL